LIPATQHALFVAQLRKSANEQIPPADAWTRRFLPPFLLAYSFLAGLHTIADFDVWWQMSQGRWIVRHGAIPATDVFSFTAANHLWRYPPLSGLIFYGLFRIYGLNLLCWFAALVCALTTALILRKRSLVCCALVLPAISVVAARTGVRADMFSVLFFAAFLHILWRNFRRDRKGIWILPLLMIFWVNLHLGFIVGIALLLACTGTEILEMSFEGDRRRAAWTRLRAAAPCFVVTLLVTLINPWGWRIYSAVLEQERVMPLHSQWISEWAKVPLNWESLVASSGTKFAFFVLLAITVVGVVLGLVRREPGAVLFLCCGSYFAVRHIRFEALFACMVVVVAEPLISAALPLADNRPRVRVFVTSVVASVLILVAVVESVNLVSNRSYLRKTSLALFGPGISWWFPSGATDFIRRERPPGRIFNSYNEGGFLVWDLGDEYSDYIDGRALPFGPELFRRQDELMKSPPDSQDWQQESARYDIKTLVVSLARYDGLELFPVLRQFCASPTWRPVYMDEVSAVFLRSEPDTEELIHRFAIDCATAPLPFGPINQNRALAFNQWANAAAILFALGREQEALLATDHANQIFPSNANVHFIRARLFLNAGHLQQAENEFSSAVELEPTELTWSGLAQCYRAEGRLSLATDALRHAAGLSRTPHLIFLNIAYIDLAARQPHEALDALEESLKREPVTADLVSQRAFRFAVARAQASALAAAEDIAAAVASQRQAILLEPDDAEAWAQLAELYQLQRRPDEAKAARDKSVALASKSASR
jgi:Flp pilus assembly protein TadD